MQCTLHVLNWRRNSMHFAVMKLVQHSPCKNLRLYTVALRYCSVAPRAQLSVQYCFLRSQETVVKQSASTPRRSNVNGSSLPYHSFSRMRKYSSSQNNTQYFKVESSNRAARLSNVQRSSSSSPWELRPIRAKQSGGGDSQSLESGNRLNYSKNSDKKFKDNINRTSVMRRVSSVSQSLPQDVEIKPFRDRCSAKSSVPVKSNTGRSSNSREEWQIQKQSLLKKFGPSGWMPRKRLSPDALEGIRALHSQFPEKYPTPVLAEQFKVSPEAVRRILKSKWRPNEEEEESRRKRWDRRGKAIWDQMAEIGIKPPKKWRKMGVGKNRKRLVGVNESSQVSELRHAFGNISNDRKIQKDFQTNHGMHHDISLSDRML